MLRNNIRAANVPRLLMSARDPNAAHQLVAVYQCNAECHFFDICAFASGPAKAILQENGIPFSPGIELTAVDLDDPASTKILNWAQETVHRERPNAVVVGLSGPEAGIDEAFLRVASVPTFAIQDFWGDVNACFGRLANTYLVSDELAERLTRAKGARRAHAIGQPKYAKYPLVDPASAREDVLSAMRWEKDRPIILFAGQPLWAYPAYTEMLVKFFRGVAKSNLESCLLLRPHPKETDEERQRLATLASDFGYKLMDSTHISAANLVGAADVVASGFSMMCQDKVAMTRATGGPGAALIVLTSDLRSVFTKITGLSSHPLVDLELARMATDEVTISDALNDLLDSETQAAYRRRATERIIDPSNSPIEVLRSVGKEVGDAQFHERIG